MAACLHSAFAMQQDMNSKKPVDARDPNAYSDGYTLRSGAYALPSHQTIKLGDSNNYKSIRFDRLERSRNNAGDLSTAYDFQGWFGNDHNRLVLKAEGDYSKGKFQEARTEALWGHPISGFFDSQVGVRNDSGVGPNRNWLAFGVEGLAPYWFDVQATVYLGTEGRSAVRASAEYDLLLTQHLILQPRFEMNYYGKQDAARQIGSGLSDGLIGLRLRYEITRQFAPYVGIERVERFGQTADMLAAGGEITGETKVVAGVRMWF